MSVKSKQKSTVVGLKDLRENMETFITRVRAGETLTIMRRSEAVFRITPVSAQNDAEWETVIDFTKEIGGGMPIDELLASIKTYGQKRKVS